MSVTIADVQHIAALARLSFPPEEQEKFTHQLNTILSYIDQLERIDTTNVEPLSHVIEVENVFRPDVTAPGLTKEEALKNAPSRTEDFFKVPKVLGDS